MLKKDLSEQVKNFPAGPKNHPSVQKTGGGPKNHPTAKNSGGLQNIENPDGSLTYSMRNNLYVYQVQRSLNMPMNYCTGNYLDKTKAAVAAYIQQNNIQGVKPDGSVITADLYDKILGGGNTTPAPAPQSQNQPQAAPADTTPQNSGGGQNAPQNASGGAPQSYAHSQLEFPLYMGQGNPKDGFDPSTYGRYITNLQTRVGARTTGIMDQQTFDAVKKFIGDPKHKEYLTEPIDSDSLNVLNNEAAPGITAKLYTTINGLSDDIIRHNRTVKNVDNVVNEVRKVLRMELRRLL
jgi:hypothetical protein